MKRKLIRVLWSFFIVFPLAAPFVVAGFVGHFILSALNGGWKLYHDSWSEIYSGADDV